MSPYEELRERCALALFLDGHPDESWTRVSDLRKNYYCGHARAVLAEVFRTLETVTPEMASRWAIVTPIMPFRMKPDETSDEHSSRLSTDVWLAMLSASPLAPPKDKP